MDVVSAFVRDAHDEHTAALTEITDAAAPEEKASSADVAQSAGEDGCADHADAEVASARGPRTALTRPPPEATPLTSPTRTADTAHPSRLVTLRNRRDRDTP